MADNPYVKSLVRRTNIHFRSPDMCAVYDALGGDKMLMRVMELIAVLTTKDAQSAFVIPSPDEGKPPLLVLAPEDQPSVMDAALKLFATAYMVAPEEFQAYLDQTTATMKEMQAKA